MNVHPNNSKKRVKGHWTSCDVRGGFLPSPGSEPGTSVCRNLECWTAELLLLLAPTILSELSRPRPSSKPPDIYRNLRLHPDLPLGSSVPCSGWGRWGGLHLWNKGKEAFSIIPEPLPALWSPDRGVYKGNYHHLLMNSYSSSRFGLQQGGGGLNPASFLGCFWSICLCWAVPYEGFRACKPAAATFLGIFPQEKITSDKHSCGTLHFYRNRHKKK